MSKYISIIAFLCFVIFITSCEDEFIPETNNAEQVYIVEGYVSASDRPVPPYVIFSQSVPFFSEVGPSTLSNIFVRNADISISDGDKTVQLTEVCLDQLTPEMKKMFSSGFGLDSVSEDFNFCVYIDIASRIDVHEGGKYELNIKVNDTEITANTSIPIFVGLDSIWTQDTPGTALDSFNQLYCQVADPAGEANFYQYKNGYVNDRLVTPFVSSIADFLFDGKDFKFPMDRAVRNYADEDQDTFAYFRKGDSIQVEWICIDKDQYEFWNTLELDRVQQGPFSSYVKAKTNVHGAIGVFSGRSSKLYTVKN